MNKEVYMQELREKLSSVEETIRDEIIADYEEHFYEGSMDGRSEQDIINELGNIDDMIEGLKDAGVWNNIDNNRHNTNDRNEYADNINLNEEKHEDKCSSGIKNDRSERTKESYADSKEYEDTKDADIESMCKKIVVDAGNADLHIMHGSQTGTTVRYKAAVQPKQAGFYHYEQDGVLYVGISRKESYKRLSFFGKLLTAGTRESIEINVANDVSELEIKAISGDVYMNNVDINDISIKAVTGDIQMNDMISAYVNIETASGDMELERVKSCNLKIKAASGDIELRDYIADNIEISTQSGDIECSNILTNQNMRLFTASGDIDMEEVTYNLGEFKTGSGDIEIRREYRESDNNSNTKCKTGSGDVELDMHRCSGIKLDIMTGSGDADVWWNNQSNNDIRNGSYTFGDGRYDVTVITGSGDVDIKN